MLLNQVISTSNFVLCICTMYRSYFVLFVIDKLHIEYREPRYLRIVDTAFDLECILIMKSFIYQEQFIRCKTEN